MLFKILLVLAVFFFAFRGKIRRRWPDLGRRIQTVLILSLIAVTGYRVIIWLSH